MYVKRKGSDDTEIIGESWIMKAVVLGAGVTGVTAAYELARDGHDVTVIDRREGPALETSFANGGQLSWDHGEPLAGPGVLKKAIKWLGRQDAPLLVKARLDPTLWAWTIKFLTAVPEPRFWRNAERMLRVSLYARERVHETLKAETIDFDHQRKGILGLFADEQEFDHVVDGVRAWKEIDAARCVLDRKGCLELEPALHHSTLRIVGGLHTPHDESGDCYEFTRKLAARCETMGVQFQWNTTVHGLARQGWEITHAATDKGDVVGDVFVLSLGSYSPLIAKPLGLDLPIYPAKGYSLTMPIIDDSAAPHVSITNHAHKLVFSRFGNKLRVAGMLELGGYDTEIDTTRANVVLNNALKLFPRAADPEHVTFWTGLRPLTPDGPPIIGRAKQKNLILNTGHGMLGWTMGAGTARIVADLVAGHAPEIEMEGLGWERYD